MSKTTLRALLQDSRDGEWGKGEPGLGRRMMSVIRGTDFPAVRVGDLEGIPRRYLEERHATRKRVQPWDILIETAGGSPDRPTGRTLLLKPSLFDRLGPDVTCASFARFLRIDEAKADPRFVFWMLQHHYEARDLLQFNTQHTGVARFQFTTFAEGFLLTLPDRQTQRRIASILGAYDDLIDVNRRRIALLEEMARRLFEEWFVHFRFPGHEGVSFTVLDEARLPLGWHVKPLAAVAAINGDTIRPAVAPTRIGYIDISSVSVGTVENVEWMQFADAPGRARRRVADGSIIWSMVRPNRRSYALLLDPKPNTVASTGFAVLDARALPFAYLFQAVTTDAFVAHLTGSATGAAYPAVTGTVFERACIVVPPDALLATYAAIAEPMLRLASRLRTASEWLAASRDILLPRLMSGELSVVAAERELEAAA